MLAQAAACLVMTWDLVHRGMVRRLCHREGGAGSADRRRPDALVRWQIARARRAPRLGLAAGRALRRRRTALAGLWWTAAVYAPGVPAARPDRGVLSVVVAMVLIAGATALCLRWMRARVPGVLGGWLAALVAGGLVGIVQAIVAIVIDGMQSDIWPLMSAYVAVADGLSFGACVGWIVGVSAVLIDRVTSTRRRPRAAARGRDRRGRRRRRHPDHARPGCRPQPRRTRRACPRASCARTATSSRTATATRCCSAAST